MKATPETYRKFQALILKSEGKTLEDELLEEGCIVKKPQEDLFFKVIQKWKNQYGNHFLKIWNERVGIDNWHMGWDGLEIIGTPITLERVLQALGDGYAIVNINGFWIQRIDRFTLSLKKEICKWEQCLPAHEQEEETLQSLIDILTPKFND